MPYLPFSVQLYSLPDRLLSVYLRQGAPREGGPQPIMAATANRVPIATLIFMFRTGFVSPLFQVFSDFDG